MIGRIQGRLVEVIDSLALIDVGGVGYEVELTGGAHAMLGLAGAEVSLFTHMIVREDAHLLFGFSSRQERDVFRLLIRVNGVGPKLAVALLSGLSIGELVKAVAAGETARLTRVPGIGKRTAERLFVDLKDKLDGLVQVDAGETAPIYRRSRSGLAEAMSALIALGYRPPEAERALAAIPEDVVETEAIIRLALKGFVRDGGVGA